MGILQRLKLWKEKFNPKQTQLDKEIEELKKGDQDSGKNNSN